ncbi:MAG: hypothetical protein EXQ83_13855 [Xanthobacteraceae bacterium]|nr:hypothetical protein [Xanthobacteraceae bacterium]
MFESTALLHNMSAPPKSVVKYAGLADFAGGAGSNPDRNGVFGRPVRFVLPAGTSRVGAPGILRLLGIKPGRYPGQQLCALIDERARELPLPDGCAVVPFASGHRIIWADILSTLAVLTKCSDAIWLRTKSPAIQAGLHRRGVSLLVPPLFVARLPGATP